MKLQPRHISSRSTSAARGALVVLMLLLGWQATLGAAQAQAQTIHFQGRTVQAPDSWPVYRLSQHPGMCVRLDRRAVYLGTPSANQHCPAGTIGRRLAILVEPPSAARARAQALPSPLLRAPSAAARGDVFTGLGFDACSAPSTKTMSAWKASPYRGIGVYIGGINRGCSQPNLTSSWVAAETAAVWHLIPIYVGRQAPSSSCGSCAKLSAASAGAQGTAAATDAVAKAAEVAIGPGNPIYFDMESYTRTSSATAATLAFLQAWTKKLHTLGYLSGIYSSSASGIADLAGTVGSEYQPPDALWIANWNGQQNTSDPAVPAGAWTPHQRIHQYRGGHNESYGGVTINIDNDYIDAPTVGAALSVKDNPVGVLDLIGSPGRGQVRAKGWAFDPNAPTQPLAIRLVVGGQLGERGALSYELGTIATQPRAVVSAQFPEAGSAHGFDTTVSTIRSGQQRVCAYALNVAPGRDKLLGCKGTSVPVALSISKLKATRNAVYLRVDCEWPTGTECPGQISLRTRFRVPLRGGRTRAVSRVLGHSSFHLTGQRSHAFRVPFSAGGKAVLQARGRLKTQVVVSIPGGHRIKVIGLG